MHSINMLYVFSAISTYNPVIKLLLPITYYLLSIDICTVLIVEQGQGQGQGHPN